MNQGPLRGSALYVRLEGMLEQGVRTFADLLIYGAVAPSTTGRYSWQRYSSFGCLWYDYKVLYTIYATLRRPSR